ncbi:MAG: 3-oxoacyl-[acyl-carrier protein] reductase [Rhodobacteraceae bacterium HLUCCA12]|nr:MAG: 3-oxoacyl-[acyl-carrier protein] reductase [Rhodobacteraceae bacterium HLUCCA12]
MSKTITPLLNGRLAVVTGASGGIGRALTTGLAAHGAHVIAAGRKLSALQAVADDIAASGGRASAEVVDVADADSCRAFAARVARVGQVSVLVNNAGVIETAAMDSDAVEAAWNRTIGVNLGGTFNMVHALLEPLVATRGSVVNFSSIAAHLYTGNTVGYTASKGGISSLTVALARELGPKGVRVNAVSPGVVATGMSNSLKDPEKLKVLERRVALGRIGQPEDMVGPVVFLASSMSEYVTGTTLVADGGYTTG